jgi:hypothetical protein
MGAGVCRRIVRGKIDTLQIVQALNALRAAAEPRAPDARIDEQKSLDAQFPPASPEQYAIRYGELGQEMLISDLTQNLALDHGRCRQLLILGSCNARPGQTFHSENSVRRPRSVFHSCWNDGWHQQTVWPEVRCHQAQRYRYMRCRMLLYRSCDTGKRRRTSEGGKPIRKSDHTQ